jgi:hypothetical protein
MSSTTGDTFTQEARFSYPDRPGSEVAVRVRRRDGPARLARAAKTLAACWGLAVVAVFLPLLHFILVPGLLVLGVALGWSRLREAHSLIDAEGPCPACDARQHFDLGRPWRERTMLRCDACGRPLELDLPPEPAA